MTHMKSPMPDSGSTLQVQVLEPLKDVSSSLGSGYGKAPGTRAACVPEMAFGVEDFEFRIEG